MASIVAFDADEIDTALPYATRALDLAYQIGQPRLIANCQNLLGTLSWHIDNAEEGERLQREAIDRTRQSGDPLGAAMFSAQLADQLINARHLDRSETLITEARPIISRDRPDALPMLDGSTAYLSFLQGRLDDTGYYLERSLVYHQAPPHRRPDMLAMILMIAAELASRRDLPEQGVRLLAASHTILERIGLLITKNAQADVRRAEEELRAQVSADRYMEEWDIGREMSIPEAIDLAMSIARVRSGEPASETPTTSSLDDDLTPREREVLMLLAEGKSNAAIARQLFISQRTVTTHLSRLSAKLDVFSRSEAIFAALRMGLVDQT